ncbi:hypothetical protein L1049_016000 [Liquidambar formosana]|uniref:Uncharacterized protein n=1 Tax=Liquidambar formosana TaxID=63359 RepID=A0AAP0RZX0_LIQFO
MFIERESGYEMFTQVNGSIGFGGEMIERRNWAGMTGIPTRLVCRTSGYLGLLIQTHAPQSVHALVQIQGSYYMLEDILFYATRFKVCMFVKFQLKNVNEAYPNAAFARVRMNLPLLIRIEPCTEVTTVMGAMAWLYRPNSEHHFNPNLQMT